MNLASLVGHITELLSLTHGSAQPVDRTVATFFHSRTYLGSRDRRFISDAVYGIIRNRRYLEALLEHLVDSDARAADLDLPMKRYLALYGLYSLTLAKEATGGGVPPSLWTAAFPSMPIEDFTAWADTHRDLPGLEGATLLAVRESFQDWMVERWSADLGEELPALLAALNVPADVAIRVNTLKTTRDELAPRLLAEGVPTVAARHSADALIASKRFNAQALSSFTEGLFEVQDEGSQLVSLLAAPAPGQSVVDGCAGAGGKALHMAALMKNTGTIVAIDSDAKRLRELERRARRAGAAIIVAVPFGNLVPGNLTATADLVLVDAPCSGSGTIRRNPAFKWSLSESLVAHYAEQQGVILAANADFVKPGGRLAYATCSIFRQENEGVVEAFLAAHPEFSIVSLAGPAAALGLEGAGETLTFYPHRTRTDGFFLALMERAA
jgi:16S rRNA (cytosine967-C5)-methyltransferase